MSLFSALFVLYPYLTIHMRELGINVEETAIMSAVTPVVAIVMPPLAGMLADKIGNFRVCFSILQIFIKPTAYKFQFLKFFLLQLCFIELILFLHFFCVFVHKKN